MLSEKNIKIKVEYVLDDNEYNVIAMFYRNNIVFLNSIGILQFQYMIISLLLWNERYNLIVEFSVCNFVDLARMSTDQTWFIYLSPHIDYISCRLFTNKPSLRL